MADYNLSPDDEKPGAPELGKRVEVPSPQPRPEVRTEYEPDNLETEASDSPGPAFQPEPTNSRGVEVPRMDRNYTARDRKNRTKYLKAVRESRPRKSKKGPIALLIILLLVIAAAVFYWLVIRVDTAQAPQAKTDQQATNTPQPVQQQSSTVEAKTYYANGFPLSLKYPASWTVDEKDGLLTITSPVQTLTDASQQTMPGEIVLTIQDPKQAKLKEFSQGDVVAVLESQRIAYTHPSSTQRGHTYISFLQYPRTVTKGGLDAIYVTGNAGYKYAQVIPKQDLTAVNPLIGVSFISCGNSDCPAKLQSPMTISSDSWQALSKPVLLMLKSVQIT